MMILYIDSDQEIIALSMELYNFILTKIFIVVDNPMFILLLF